MKINRFGTRADRTAPIFSNDWKYPPRKFPIIGNLSALVIGAWSLVISSAIATDFPVAWKNIQPVTVEKTGLVKLSIPLETLDAARPALEDLRLYDFAGRETPFFIERPRQSPKIIKPAKNFRVVLAGNTTIATMDTGIGTLINAIALETPAREFLKGVTLEGSNDGKIWQAIARNEPVFRQSDGASKLRLSFAPAAWTQLRITLDDRRAAPIPLTGAQLFAAELTPAPAEPLDVKITERDELPGQTRFTLQSSGARVTLAGIEIETPEQLFTRRVTLAYRTYIDNEVRENEIARGLIYRIALEGQPAATNLVFAEDTPIPNRELILTIHNGDSPPLPVSAIRATRRPLFISWLVSQPGTFHLLSGNPACPSPQYDLSQLPRNVSGTIVQLLERPALGANPAWHPTDALPEVGESGTAIDLAKWKFRKRIELGTVGVQQLELDLETLSRANPFFSDLRVIRGGTQQPYLLERTSFVRNFTPAAEKLTDPKRPTVTRWSLRLPDTALPVSELACETDAPFFRRDTIVSEDISDERGDLHTVCRGSVSWLRASGGKKTTLRIPLSGPITTDKLVLEFDNGDNAPLELKEFKLSYRATRILFKAAPGADTFLYFGNRDATSPRYDLELVAPQLLAAEKTKAKLGPAEQLKKSSWIEHERFQGTGSWIFWIALGGVVIVLLIVIARLLPKPNN